MLIPKFSTLNCHWLEGSRNFKWPVLVFIHWSRFGNTIFLIISGCAVRPQFSLIRKQASFWMVSICFSFVIHDKGFDIKFVMYALYSAVKFNFNDVDRRGRCANSLKYRIEDSTVVAKSYPWCSIQLHPSPEKWYPGLLLYFQNVLEIHQN